MRRTEWRKEHMASVAQEHSLFEIDRELDTLLDEIEEEIENRGEASAELMALFQQFCEAHSEKADRIGRFLRMMEARVQHCRSEAGRLQERARSSERKATQTKYMVMYYLKSRDLKKIEGREFTLRIQKNSQDSVRFTDETLVPMRYRTVAARIEGSLWERLIENTPEALKRLLVASVQEAMPSNEAIKNAVQNKIAVPGAELYRGDHLRVV
jgi:Siphovirus Gp157